MGFNDVQEQLEQIKARKEEEEIEEKIRTEIKEERKKPLFCHHCNTQIGKKEQEEAEKKKIVMEELFYYRCRWHNLTFCYDCARMGESTGECAFIDAPHCHEILHLADGTTMKGVKLYNCIWNKLPFMKLYN